MSNSTVDRTPVLLPAAAVHPESSRQQTSNSPTPSIPNVELSSVQDLVVRIKPKSSPDINSPRKTKPPRLKRKSTIAQPKVARNDKADNAAEVSIGRKEDQQPSKLGGSAPAVVSEADNATEGGWTDTAESRAASRSGTKTPGARTRSHRRARSDVSNPGSVVSPRDPAEDPSFLPFVAKKKAGANTATSRQKTATPPDSPKQEKPLAASDSHAGRSPASPGRAFSTSARRQVTSGEHVPRSLRPDQTKRRSTGLGDSVRKGIVTSQEELSELVKMESQIEAIMYRNVQMNTESTAAVLSNEANETTASPRAPGPMPAPRKSVRYSPDKKATDVPASEMASWILSAEDLSAGVKALQYRYPAHEATVSDSQVVTEIFDAMAKSIKSRGAPSSSTETKL